MTTDRTRRALLAAAAGSTVLGSAGCVEITTPADLARATDITGNVSYFVGTEWLRERLGSVTVLDARQERFFRAERIYGARRVPLGTIIARTESNDGHGLVPDTDTLAAAIGELGVAPDEDIVVYGDTVGARVTRTVFVLHALGHRGNVHVLNGGFMAWNGRVGTGRASTPAPVTYDPDPKPDLWVHRAWLADHVGTFNDDGPGLIDVREPDAYVAAVGSDALEDEHARHGHLPGAVNVHWMGNIDGRSLADPAELYQRYTADAGLTPDEPVVVYGNDNVDPTQTWVTLRAIGFDDVRLYDGGFGEWANQDDQGRYPVETGTTAVVDVDGEIGGTDGGDFTCN